jgi:hypothetical protein
MSQDGSLLEIFLMLIQMGQYERHTQRKPRLFLLFSNVDFLKAHIKISYLYNFEKFWISLL